MQSEKGKYSSSKTEYCFS